MIENFNEWRNKYDTLTFEEQRLYHNHLEELYPEQAHYDLASAKIAFEHVKPLTVVEAGAWKANLAAIILNENATIEQWQAIELSTNAINKTLCKDDRFSYIDINRFDWWNEMQFEQDLFLATHFIEHLSGEHLTALINAINTKAVYFEAPITNAGEAWNDFHGTHKLHFGWDIINSLFTIKGYNVVNITNHCKLYIK
jgi:hypothetical protein